VRGDTFRDFVHDQLRDLGPIELRAMFGGYGLYHGDRFFGIVYQGRLYFRTDTASRRPYVDAGMRPFRPNARQTLGSYFEVPPDVVEDGEMLVAWAHAALAAQPTVKRARRAGGVRERGRRRSG
jgi:DNA transformation protein and related proteins